MRRRGAQIIAMHRDIDRAGNKVAPFQTAQ
jgi:hypothetical protein